MKITAGDYAQWTGRLSIWRVVFLVAAIAVPAALLLCSEGQARRLDELASAERSATELAARGEITSAHVLRSTDAGIVTYVYTVHGREYDMSARTGATFTIDEALPVAYLREDPAFSRPAHDRQPIVAEAALLRTRYRILALVIASYFLLFVFIIHRERRHEVAADEVAEKGAEKRRRFLFVLVPLSTLYVWSAINALRDHLQGSSSLVASLPEMLPDFLMVVLLLWLVDKDKPSIHARSLRFYHFFLFVVLILPLGWVLREHLRY